MAETRPTFEQWIIQILQTSLTKRVEEIRSDVVQNAVEEFSRRVRDAVGNAAINLANFYSVERIGPELVIRVRMESDPQAWGAEEGWEWLRRI